MKLSFNKKPRPHRPVVHDWLVIYYVRTGEYDRSGIATGPLTKVGFDQARAAGKLIRRHAGDIPVVVFTGSPLAYEQTSRNIAATLGTESIEPLFRYRLNEYYIQEVQRGLLNRGINHVVMVENGSHLAALLSENYGPPVTIGIMGPSYGSVHALRIQLGRINGRAAIVEQHFLDDIPQSI